MREIKEFLKSKGFTDSSVKTYECVLTKIFSRIGRKFTEEQLENLFTKLNLSPRAYNLYRSVCNFYTKKYLGFELHFTKAKVSYRLATIITEQEFYYMLKTIRNFKHKIIISIMYRCGLRISEVCRVKKEDIDIEKFRLFVRQGKGKKDRITVIPKSLAYYLSVYAKNIEGYLFETYNGYISERSVENILKEAIRKFGINKKIVTHDLRKNFAINLEQKGVKVTDIQKMLGHSKLTTTQGYLDKVQDDLTEIAMKA
jgi:integrase